MTSRQYGYELRCQKHAPTVYNKMTPSHMATGWARVAYVANHIQWNWAQHPAWCSSAAPAFLALQPSMRANNSS